MTSERSSGVDGLWLFRGAAVAVAGISVYLYVGSGYAPSTADVRNAVNVIAGASATILGFLVSAGALLYAVSNTTLARNLQKTGHFGRLLADLFLASGAFLVALVVGLVCLLLPSTPVTGSKLGALDFGMYALIFTNVLSYLLLVPVGHKMWVFLSNLTPDNPGTLE